MDPYDQAAAHLLALPEGDLPLVVFVGPPCRTHYADIHKLRALIADLYALRPYAAVYAGMYPFDMYVERFCQEFGIPAYLAGPADQKFRLISEYARDPDLAMGTSLLVAFPVEEAVGGVDGPKKARVFPPESADLDVVRGAIQHGVPILAVYRNGDAIWRRT